MRLGERQLSGSSELVRAGAAERAASEFTAFVQRKPRAHRGQWVARFEYGDQDGAPLGPQAFFDHGQGGRMGIEAGALQQNVHQPIAARPARRFAVIFLLTPAVEANTSGVFTRQPGTFACNARFQTATADRAGQNSDHSRTTCERPGADRPSPSLASRWRARAVVAVARFRVRRDRSARARPCRSFPSSNQLVEGDRQVSNALARGVEDRVGDRSRDAGDADFTDAFGANFVHVWVVFERW